MPEIISVRQKGLEIVLTNFYNSVRIFTRQNSTVILTGVGVTGTITVAYLTGKASFQAAEIIRRNEENGPLELKEKAALVWPLYIPAAGISAVSITSIIMANRLDSKKAAALAAAYGLSERAFVEYKDKVVERLGENKELQLREAIAQDRVNNNPVSQVIMTGSGEVLCYDSITGRYFESTIETIKKAMNDINYRIMQHGHESLSAFYDEIGLPATSYSDEVGWNSSQLLDISFSTTMSSDDRPCIAIDFTVAPTHGYTHLY